MSSSLPKTTRRQASSFFLARAERLIIFISDRSPTAKGDRVIIDALTPVSQLEQEFPNRLAGTLYDYFCSTQKADQPVSFVWPGASPAPLKRQRIYREAALGMMDNMHFR